MSMLRVKIAVGLLLAFQIFSGGLLFGAMFMATDPVTSPFTKAGKYVFGLSLTGVTVDFNPFFAPVKFAPKEAMIFKPTIILMGSI